jgi:hypothetical protein
LDENQKLIDKALYLLKTSLCLKKITSTEEYDEALKSPQLLFTVVSNNPEEIKKSMCEKIDKLFELVDEQND